MKKIERQWEKDICPQCGGIKSKRAKRCFICNQPLKGLKGPNHPAWKGGQMRDKDGYIKTYAPDHPYGARASGYVRENIRVMELHLSRRLLPNEIVHHEDENIDNNDISNLCLMDAGEHARMHRKRDGSTERLRALSIAKRIDDVHDEQLRCRKCKKWKDDSEFYKSVAFPRRRERALNCKPCANQMSYKSRARKKAEQKEVN